MTIEERTGDIFKQLDIDVVVHQANLYHTFGAGIAKIIRERYPYAYDADRATKYGDEGKLGTFSIAYGHPDPVFVNLYSQYGIGGQDRNTSYDAMAHGLHALEKHLYSHNPKALLGIPHTMGCGLAGGDWTIVRAIIESVFADSIVKVVICKLP